MATKDFKDLRIVFMGTPEFAVASLDALVQSGANIVAVITAPDKPAGRGMKLNESSVKQYAVTKGLQLLQPEKLKDPAFLESLKALNADLQIVVAFRMLPEVVWNMPPLGTINVHGSLLPQYRGAAPINWAVINGEKETGVTTFKLKHEIDTGDILLQEAFPIDEDETAGDVHDKMKGIGAQLLVRTVKGIAEGSIEPTSQKSIINDQTTDQVLSSDDQAISTIKHAPKIFTETYRIDWNKSVDEVYDLIRGLAPYPAAFTYLNEKTLKIFKARKEKTQTTIAPGEWQTDNKTFIRFACTNGSVSLEEIQLEGKKRMNVAEFLRGYRLNP